MALHWKFGQQKNQDRPMVGMYLRGVRMEDGTGKVAKCNVRP